MKKSTMKKLLAVLSLATITTVAVGVNNVISASASTTIDDAFKSVGLIDGASVRYNTDGVGMGFSFMLKMNKDDYNTVMAENSPYSDIKFGILIGPNAYYKMYPFYVGNEINTNYYTLNEDVENDGKGMIYNMVKTELIEYSEDPTLMCFRGSILGIQDENMVRDYRGVGYVEYTHDIGGQATTERYFFTDDVKNVRCPVEVADKAIAAMKLDGVTADEQTKIDVLNTNYSSKVNWTITPDVDPACAWYTSWSSYCMIDSGKARAPELSWDTSNRYINSKYTTTYQLEKDGREPIVATYTPNGDPYFEDKLIEGKWTIKGYTSCSMWEDPTPIVSYSREMIYNQFYTMPKVNGADVMVGDANTNANPSAGGYSMLTNTWDETTGRYNFNSNTGWVMGYGRKATNDFIVDFDIDAIHRKDFRIYTSTDTPIIFRSHFGGVNGFFIGVKDTWFGAGKITGPANVYTAPHNDLVDMRLRVAMYDDVLYIFGNTYTNSAGVLAESDTWLLLATLSETNGIQCYNGMSYASEDGKNNHEGPFYKAVKDAATNDEYAFAVANHQYTAGTTVYMALEDDDQVVADFIKENPSVAVINNVSFTYSAETNTYSTTTAGAKMEMGSTTGDWMARVKLNSVTAATSAVELRIQISETKYIILRSGVDTIGQGGIFFRTPDCFPNAAGGTQDRWWSETFVGYNTSKFVNEDDCTAEGSDGYLDLMIVRSGGTIYFYGCEYLDAEGKAVDYASWQLIFAFKSDKNVEFGADISYKDAGGSTNGVNGHFTGPASEVAAATAHTFIMVQSAGKLEGNVVINDDDAAVATFMNGEKLLADYAKI